MLLSAAAPVPSAGMKTLILGGARSGKSSLAQRLATEHGGDIIVIATALAADDEMRARIARHRADRPTHWRVVEEPLELGDCLRELSQPGNLVLVDCLTLWLTQILTTDDSAATFDARRAGLIEAVQAFPGRLLLVSNETGMGVMPLGELSRRFCDEAGWLHQVLAAHCDEVILTVAGLPHWLKGAAS